jgi:hypothetical protein
MEKKCKKQVCISLADKYDIFASSGTNEAPKELFVYQG